MRFRNSRFNRQLNKLLDAGIKLRLETEGETRVVSVKNMSETETRILQEAQDLVESFQTQANKLEEQRAANLIKINNISISMNKIEADATLGMIGAFFNRGYRAQRKQISILKRQNKAIKKQIAQNYKQLKESKKQEKKAIKEFEKFEERIVRLGHRKKYEIKFITYFHKNEDKFVKRCSDKEVEEIRKCVKSMQNDVKLEKVGTSPKMLFELLKDALKGKRRISTVEFVSPYAEYVEPKPDFSSKCFHKKV